MDKKSNFMANLMKAKQTMDAVETGNYKVDHAQAHAMMSQTPDNLLQQLPEGATPNMGARAQKPVTTPTNSQIQNSNLPENVKSMLMENPPQQVESGGGPTFTMDDVRAMVQKTTPNAPVPQQVQQTPQNQVSYAQAPQQQLTETVVTNSKGQMLITLTEEELEQKIQDGITKYMTEQFAKTLRTETIKRTVQALIKEGKLKVRTKSTK